MAGYILRRLFFKKHDIRQIYLKPWSNPTGRELNMHRLVKHQFIHEVLE